MTTSNSANFAISCCFLFLLGCLATADEGSPFGMKWSCPSGLFRDVLLLQPSLPSSSLPPPSTACCFQPWRALRLCRAWSTNPCRIPDLYFRPLFILDAHTRHEIIVTVPTDLCNLLQGIVSVQRVLGDVWRNREGGGSIILDSKLPDLLV